MYETSASSKTYLTTVTALEEDRWTPCALEFGKVRIEEGDVKINYWTVARSRASRTMSNLGGGSDGRDASDAEASDNSARPLLTIDATEDTDLFGSSSDDEARM